MILLIKFDCEEEELPGRAASLSIIIEVNKKRKYTFLSLFSINSYFETEPDIQSIIQPDVQDAAQTTLELLLSILNLDFIRKDIEFTSIYKEILYASDGMLKYWYRTGNYDVTVFEQEYLEMINHWEIVYRKGTENDRKQL